MSRSEAYQSMSSAKITKVLSRGTERRPRVSGGFRIVVLADENEFKFRLVLMGGPMASASRRVHPLSREMTSSNCEGVKEATMLTSRNVVNQGEAKSDASSGNGLSIALTSSVAILSVFKKYLKIDIRDIIHEKKNDK